jgi:hypothetical protein
MEALLLVTLVLAGWLIKLFLYDNIRPAKTRREKK